MSKGWISKTRVACKGNNNGYLYALISIGKNNGNVFDYSDDKNYHLNNDIEYIGITNNPVQRLNGHRCDKGKSKRIGMVIFNEAKSPTEGKMLEAEAIYNYCEAKGHGPRFQKGHDTWAGA